MLYGNLIFLKKTGGDGSKFPVTEKNIKIGRSEECLIRIYNPQVAPEHCQLIIEENGQATLRNLSDQTILNGKPLGQKNVVLCHGDIFQIGERLARWEYLQTSKYYRQILSPTGRLVAVVTPQQRPLGGQTTPRTSISVVSASKNTPLGKRRYSERALSENSPAVKMRKSSGSELIHKSRGDLSKFLMGRHSLKPAKVMLHNLKVKERKSISGMISTKTPKGKVGVKSRKSTLPLWEVNTVTPPGKKSPRSADSLKKSQRKSVKSPKTPSKNLAESKPLEKLLSASKSKINTPKKILMESEVPEDTITSASSNVLKTPLKTITESSPKSGRGSSRSRSRSPQKPSSKSPSKVISSTPKRKSPNFTRLIYSESKLTSAPDMRKKLLKGGNRRMTSMLEKLDPISGQNLMKSFSGSAKKEKDAKIKALEVVSDTTVQTPIKTNSVKKSPPSRKTSSTRKSIMDTPSEKISRKSKDGRKSLVKKTPKSSKKVKVQTPVKSAVKNSPSSLKKRLSKTPRSRISKKFNLETSVEKTPDLIDLGNTPSPKESSRKSTSKSTPLRKTPAKSPKKTKSPSPRRKLSSSQNKIMSSPLSPGVNQTTAPNSVRSPQRQTKLELKVEVTSGQSGSSLKGSATSPRGVHRKLSPSSSAERAAKKLKTSSPRKPDKNKKAALLVLGKANRKHILSQNVKVLLKQKIVKKALKQSNAIVSKQKIEKKKEISGTTKQALRKNTKMKKIPKSKKSKKATKSTAKGTSPSKTPKKADSPIISSPAKSKTKSPTKSKVSEANQSSPSKVLQTPSRLSSKSKPTEATPRSLSKQNKSESPSVMNAFKGETTNYTSSFGKSPENYLFNSYRRCSKRLSSKNDTGRPDFIELSPTALGLMPKNLDIFKTPKDKRRSSSLATPKNVRTTGIIKSASTSKIGNRKSVRFSPKDVSINSMLSTTNTSEKTDLDFSSFQTPDITMDIFVSPLSEKISVSKKDMNDSKLRMETEEVSKSLIKNRRSNLEPKLCIRRLLQSPQSKNISDKISPNKIISQNSKSPVISSTPPKMVSREIKSSDNYLSDFKGVRKLFETPKTQKSPKNSLSDLKGVSKLLRTPKVMNSPKNELTDLIGVKKLLQTPEIRKTPKNDLTDVRGVKKLFRTPKVQKSPKNDLTDVRGIKKLLGTPKVQKSPKNDLTDIKGVKKLLKTPKVQRSPKNELTDMRGVKKLLQTPKVQKSPKNDLSDVRGVKKLLGTPKVQKSPKNDLTDIKGVKRLLQTPKVQKSPKNDLTDVRGVKKLLQTPKAQKSPKNDLTDIRGVKRLMQTPKVQKSPKNDLTDVRGVKRLLQTPKLQNSPKNELSDLRGVKRLLGSPKLQKSPKNTLLDVSGIGNLFESSVSQKFSRNSGKELIKSPQAKEDLNKSSINITELKQLLISKTPESISKDKKTVSHKSRDFRAIRGRRTIHSTPKGPKNDLSDLVGVRELFLRNQPISDYNVDLAGIAELFDLHKPEVVTKRVTKSRKISASEVSEVPKARSLRQKTASVKKETKEIIKVSTRGNRIRKAQENKSEKKTTKKSKLEVVDSKEKRTTKRKAEEKVKTSRVKKVSVVLKKSQETVKKARKPSGKSQATVKKSPEKNSRKRKSSLEDLEITPPKLSRKLRGAEKPDSATTKETPEKSLSRSGSEKKISSRQTKSAQKVSVKTKAKKTSEASTKVQIKKATKTTTKKSPKVQNKRSQSKSKNTSKSEEKVSPRKTRSVKAKTATKTGSVGGAATKKKSPVVKRTTRQRVK